jgi:hypothetical protein
MITRFRLVAAAGELTDREACLDIADMSANLREVLHDGRRGILRNCIEWREAGWNSCLFLFVPLNQPSLFSTSR